MPIQYINTGTAPNQGNGDSLRLAFTKINNNFSLLADNSFTYNAVGEVIDHPELQRGISVTYNPLNQAASFLVNIAGPDTLGAVRIGGGITLNPDTGLISVFDGNYNNLTNIPQALGTTASPTFADLHVTGSLDIAGETTIINSSGIETANLNITLAKDATSESEANTAGIIVNGPESPASLRYTASDDSWNFNKRVNIPTLYVNGQFFSPGGLGDITVDLNVISTVNQDQDIILNPDGNGRIRLVNTPMQFDNGNNGVYSDHLIYTAPNAGKVGFGIGVSNNSPRIVGDGVTPGIVADFGIYAAGTGTWTSAVTVNSDGSLKAAGTIYQGIAYDGIDFPNTAIRVDANVDSYAELVMKNHNTGTNASTDLVIMNDQGTDTENFIDLGINSSNYSVTQYSSTQPNDGYLFVNGGNLVIGTQTPNKKIVFHAGGTRDIDSTAFFDEYAWQFNRPVTIDVDKPVPLNFTVINRSSNVVAQSLFQAVNNLGNLVHFGINSSHPEAFYGRIGPNEAFLHLENSTSTLHFGSYGDVVFYSDLANGFAGTPTLVMSSIDQSSTFDGHLLPTTDLAYDLGSADKQWRSLYVSTSTIFIGGVPLTINTASNTLVVGTSTNTSTVTLATEEFVQQAISQGGGGLPTVTVPGEVGTAYKGLQASYGMVHSNGSTNELNVNKIVIHKPAITTTTIDPTSGQDDFAVTGLSDSDVLAMFVLYGNVNGAKSLNTLQTFAEAAIDNVILDGGVEGDYNTVDQMKIAFYANYSTLATAAGGLDQDFEFFTGDVAATTGTTIVREGSGAVFDITNLGNGNYYASGIQNNGTNYRAGHKIKILGTSLTGAVNTTTYTASVDYAPLDIVRSDDAIVVNTTQTAIIALLNTGTVLTNIDNLGETLTITGSGVENEGNLVYPTTGTVTVSPGTSIGQFTLAGFTFTGETPANDCIITVDSISEGGLIFQWSVSGVAAGTEEVFHGAITGTNYQTGSGVTVGSINPNNFVLNITDPGSDYVADDQVTLLGSDLQNGTSPANDIVIRIITVGGGGSASTWEYLSGTVPQGTWPSNNISDGGNDQYDTANYINSSLASRIAYNGGNTVADGATEFGTGSSYTFVYDTGIFGLLVTGNQSTSISTSGGSGADGSSITEAGNLYGPNTAEQTFDNAVTHINLIGDPYAGPIVSFTHTDNGNEVDILIPDDGNGAGVGITRDGNSGIYNPYRDEGWDSNVSPSGIGWNIDGWEDLSDVESRTYTNLYAAFGFGGLGNKIVGTECVIYLPDNGKYYAVKFDSWTQNNNGGGFAYTRRELDLTSLTEGIRFADGTRLKSAEGLGRVKLESPGARRIEEAHGYKSVTVTAVTPGVTQNAVIRQSSENWDFYVNATTELTQLYNNQNTFNYLEFSFDAGNTWIKVGFGGGQPGVYYQMVFDDNVNRPVTADDVVSYRSVTGGTPVIWWSAADLPSGNSNFRGAVIDYHAFTGDGTIIGTIHIVDDDGEENITHTEVSSGGTDLENDDLWFVQNEGTISYRRIDGAGRTLKVQWTAKVFYGSEIYD